MGIRVEYNPDLALRDYSECEKGTRKKEECLPQELKEGVIHSFLKRDQRLYWLHGELPLLQTEGGEKLSLPMASIRILEATHFVEDGEVWTKGTYKVVEVFDDDTPRFNGFAKIAPHRS